MDTKVYSFLWLFLMLQVINIVLSLRRRAVGTEVQKRYEGSVDEWDKAKDEQDAILRRQAQEWEEGNKEYERRWAEFEEKQKDWDKQLERLKKFLDRYEGGSVDK